MMSLVNCLLTSGLAEARQSKKAAEKASEGLKRRLAEAEKAAAEAAAEAEAERLRLVGASDKAARSQARAQVSLVNDLLMTY